MHHLACAGSVCGNKVESKFYQCNSDRLPTTNAAIKTALLQLYYNPLTARRQDIIISAYQLTESCTRRGGYNRILLDTKRLTCTRSDYVEFDITRAVKTWATRKSENYGIEVEVVSDGCNRSPYRYTTTPYSMYLQPNGSNVPLERRPTLFVTSDIGYSVYTTRGRRRRQTLDSRFCKSLHPKNTNCCIRDFKLNLKKDLDWDWIVQPKVINVNQCSGLCPPTWADDANHTQVSFTQQHSRDTLATRVSNVSNSISDHQPIPYAESGWICGSLVCNLAARSLNLTY